MDREEYIRYVANRAKKSHWIADALKAFWVGGVICVLGGLLKDLYLFAGLSDEKAGTLVSVTLILIAGLLTGIGVFDRIANYAGAGTLVPITGFANAVASPAIDARAEGYVLGVAAKMFTIAGPVIVYGSVSSMLYGIVYYFFLR